jgi:transcription antitermination protein NusB
MARRTKQRRDAVFALYQSDLTGRGLDDLLGRSSSVYTRALAHATEDHTDELDVLIGRHAEGWTVDRIAPLERAIMRVALYEILHRPDVPDEVAIDEAVETAKVFSGSEAPGFVNGILGGVMRRLATKGSV